MMQILLSIPLYRNAKSWKSSRVSWRHPEETQVWMNPSSGSQSQCIYGIPSHTFCFALLIDFLGFFLGEWYFCIQQNRTLSFNNFWLFHCVSYLLIPLSEVQDHPPTLVPWLSQYSPFPSQHGKLSNLFPHKTS